MCSRRLENTTVLKANPTTRRRVYKVHAGSSGFFFINLVSSNTTRHRPTSITSLSWTISAIEAFCILFYFTWYQLVFKKTRNVFVLCITRSSISVYGFLGSLLLETRQSFRHTLSPSFYLLRYRWSGENLAGATMKWRSISTGRAVAGILLILLLSWASFFFSLRCLRSKCG